MTGASSDPRRDRVTPIRPPHPMEAGRAALATGAWQDARRAFESALIDEQDMPAALEGLALAAWWLDVADTVFSARERAYRLYRERGDAVSAARIAVWLAWDYSAFRGEAAIASGWFQRAGQLLQDVPARPEHAWLAVRESAFAIFDHGDPDKALTRAADAIRIGQATHALGYEMIGRALHGLVRVVMGDVDGGMRELDGVNAAVIAGEITDPVAIALACCYLVNACERVRDTDRAVQWCERLRAFSTSWGLRPLLGVCRAQYGAVCVWRGAWSEAEQEFTAATEELRASRPAMTSESLSRLGELRRLQGRFDDAAALFEQAGHHPIAALGRAALALDRGDARHAIDLADRLLRQLPEANRTDRAAALEVLARAAMEHGAYGRARDALTDVQEIASRVGTAPLRASAGLIAGWVAAADGEHDQARRHFEDAVDLFQKSGTPCETARARLELARELGALGRSEPALEEIRRATPIFTAMPAPRDLARAIDLEGQLTAPEEETASRSRAGGLSRRELEVIRLIAAGLSNQAIAEKLFISEHTVHRHVGNILTRLNVPSRSAAVARAAMMGWLKPS